MAFTMSASRTLRIGTRASKLARWQSDWVAARLLERGAQVEIIEIATSGDLSQQGPVAALGAQGVFTKEIQAALLAGEVDLAVHSLKDLPTEQVAGLRLAAVPPREESADALVAAMGLSLDELPAGARVGTGSLRRRAQLLHLRPDLEMRDIRGNVDTRLRKLDEGQYDAIVLAVAGLKRLGLSGRTTEVLGPPRMLPAPGQGALAIECRDDDEVARQAVAALDDHATRAAVVAERAVLAALHGGCSAPIAAWGRVVGGELRLDALVADIHGREMLRGSDSAPLESSADLLGQSVADDLLARGAARLVASARGT
jgi:hydroxymethylbilane synthase